MSIYRLLPILLVCALCDGCVGWQPEPVVDEAPRIEPPVSPVPVAVPVEPDEVAIEREALPGPAGSDIHGQLQWISLYREDTLPEIARAHGLGIDEIRHANPGVDTWLPGEGTVVLLPTRMILPQQREGLVLNLASRRLFHFDQDGVLLATYPIGVGREGWATPTGAAKVVSKAKEPVWFVPASIRAEHAEAGDPLPAQIGPGPDNPLGAYAILLDLPGYLIHGTNKPYGVGMRVSHGCVRLYPEDIESLYPRVPLGTPVTIIGEPIMLAEADGLLYLEAHPPFEEDETWSGHWEEIQGRLLQDSRLASRDIDWDRARQIIEESRGIPLPVS
ncbi:MAG: L,D-transpeptidase family protein, partial [Gammaproteobacteria bacterium]|nr:L,D-transpeptidase family protein [Gammaproteobacteria bacterium]